MDKFVVDLDRILDDLEAQESQSLPSHLPDNDKDKLSGRKRDDGLAHTSHLLGPVRHQASCDLDTGSLSSQQAVPHSKYPDQIGVISSCQLPPQPDPAPDSQYNRSCETATPITSCLTLSGTSSNSFHQKSPADASSDDQKVELENILMISRHTNGTSQSQDLGDEAGSICDSSVQEMGETSRVMSLVYPEPVSGHLNDGELILREAIAGGVGNKEEDDEEILAEVMKDVEEYEKTRGTDAGPHVYEDEELNRIMESIEDWGKRSGNVSFGHVDEDFEDENEYDEDLAKLTNGLVGHASSLRPGKEISHKFATESPSALSASNMAISSCLHNHSHAAEPTPCLSFADCHVESDELSEDQMEAYLTDVRVSPQPDQPGPSSSDSQSANHEVHLRADRVKPNGDIVLHSQNKAVRPSSLDLMREPLEADTTESREAVVPDESSQADTPASDTLHDDEIRVGHHRPFWIPDEEAPVCMRCDTRFTVIKRRHHCRACGKVLCAACCNMRAKLAYMEFRETRVCSVCFRLVGAPQDLDTAFSDATTSNPDPSNPRDYCSTIPPCHQAASDASAPPLTVFVPVGVLKRADRPRGEPKQVVFSDGIRPGCDLRTEAGSDSTDEATSSTSSRRPMFHRLRSPPVELNSPLHHKLRSKALRTIVEDAAGPLPAILNCAALAAEPSADNLLKQLRGSALTFYLTKNLHVQLKLVRLDCCAKLEVWSFVSKGLSTVGQDEIAVILERVDEEMRVPRDVFRLITSIYDSSSKGLVHSEMSHILFPEGLFGCKEYCGFLFVRPTVQCLSGVILPPSPFLLALLIQRIEVPWAKVFPLRLMLRLGAEFNSYPCPVVSYRQRKAVYFEVGHTILNVLADFRNFHWTIPVVQGAVITRDYANHKTRLVLPRNRYDGVLKIINQNNEHVLALGGNLNLSADSHFACYQNEEGQYQTYILSESGSAVPLAKTENESGHLAVGASFIVFSGALKTSSGMTAKMSVVEDGVLVQIMPNVIPELKKALRDMKDYEIKIGKVGEEASDCVSVEWGPDDTNFNTGVRSPIDGRSLEGVPSVRIHNSTDFANKHFLIRWTEVFFLENQDPGRRDAIDPTKVARVIAQSLCRALTTHLDHLVAEGLHKIGLRVSLDPEQVGYEVGSNGQPLPALFVNELDEALIPVITGNFLSGIDALLVLELFFCVILK